MAKAVPKKSDVEQSKPNRKNSLKEVKISVLNSERDIAMDFAAKVYEKFNKLVKSIILFGSSTKDSAKSTSDIDIIILIDDATIQWDIELIAWYREELGKLIRANPYKKELHINTVKITTWWQDLMRGDPIIINILRYGEALIDFGGFFNPLKVLLNQGKVRSTPEAIYTCLERAPEHFARSRASQLGSVEGLFWAMVDSAHAALMAVGASPPSPEHIPIMLRENFVDKGILKMNYVVWYRDLYILHRNITHRNITHLSGAEIEEWQNRTESFISAMTEIIKKIIS